MKTCVVDVCRDRIVAQGLCKRHYEWARRHGLPVLPERPTGPSENTVARDRLRWVCECVEPEFGMLGQCEKCKRPDPEKIRAAGRRKASA